MAASDSCDADGAAIAAFAALTAGENFDLPDVDVNDSLFNIPSASSNPLYNDIEKIQITDLTEKNLEGKGFLDVIMKGMKVHLDEQFEKNRISGQQYSEVYIANSRDALSAAVQLLLGRDQAYWAAVLSQTQARTAEINAIKARVELERARVELAMTLVQHQTVKADYAGKKMQLGLMDAEYCNLLQQKRNLDLQGDTLEYTKDNILPKQGLLLDEQIEQLESQRLNVEEDTLGKKWNREHILPRQEVLILEQSNIQRAQTSNSRIEEGGGTSTVTGLLEKQKALYTQQIESYQRDAEAKAGKLFFDFWMTQMSLDETFGLPSSLSESNLNDVINKIKTANSLT